MHKVRRGDKQYNVVVQIYYDFTVRWMKKIIIIINETIYENDLKQNNNILTGEQPPEFRIEKGKKRNNFKIDSMTLHIIFIIDCFQFCPVNA